MVLASFGYKFYVAIFVPLYVLMSYGFCSAYFFGVYQGAGFHRKHRANPGKEIYQESAVFGSIFSPIVFPFLVSSLLFGALIESYYDRQTTKQKSMEELEKLRRENGL